MVSQLLLSVTRFACSCDDSWRLLWGSLRNVKSSAFDGLGLRFMISQFPLFAARFACSGDGGWRLRRLSGAVALGCLLNLAGALPIAPFSASPAHAVTACTGPMVVTAGSTLRILADQVAETCILGSAPLPDNGVLLEFQNTTGTSFEFFYFERTGGVGTKRALTYGITNYSGGHASSGSPATIILEDTIPTSGSSSTLTIDVNANGVDHEIIVQGLQWVDNSGLDAVFTSTSISGGVFGAAAPPPSSPPTSTPDASSPQARATSQQSSSTSILSSQSANLFSSGVSSAVAQRFRGGSGGDFGLGGTGQFGSAYVSTLGLSQWMRDRRAERMRDDDIVSIYDPLQPGQRMPHIHEDPSTAQEAIDATFGSAEPIEADAGYPALGFAAHDPAAPVGPVEEAPSSLNVWARGTFTHFDGNTFDGDAFSGVVGIDYLIADHILIGAMGGYESGDFTFPIDSGAFQGDGITVGGYTAIELAAGLVAEAYVTRTQLEYENQTATGIGTTQAKRTLAAFNLSGSYALSERMMFEPNVRVTYAHERQDAYIMSDGTSIGEEVIDSGTLSAGSRVSYLLPFDAYGRFRVFASGHGEFMYSSDDPSSTTLPDFSDITSARIGLGFDALFLNGWFLAVDGNVGGVGSDSFLSYTGTGRLRIPLN